MADGDSSGAGGAMWAVVTLLIILIVVGALYFGGALRGASPQKQQIDVEIKTPGS